MYFVSRMKIKAPAMRWIMLQKSIEINELIMIGKLRKSVIANLICSRVMKCIG